MWKKRVFILVITTVLILSTLSFITTNNAKGSNATTLYVGGSGPGNYTQIQNAIDNASDGNTIFVYNGIYHESVVVDKPLTIISKYGPTACIVELSNSTKNTAFHVTADYVTISGFTLKRLGEIYGLERGFYLYADYCNIVGNIILDEYFYGIYCKGCSNSIITGNTLTKNNYGIYLDPSSNNNNIITGNIITGNTTIHKVGRGISLSGSSNTVTGNNISRNTYGIILGGSNNTIMANTISHSGKRGIIFSSSGNTVTGNTFFHNGIEASSYHNTVNNNIMDGKPLIYLEGQSDITIDNSSEAGQIVLVNCTNITIQNQKLSNTSIGIDLLNTVGCLITGNTFTHNHNGIEFISSCGNTIMDNTFTRNYDNAIYLYHSDNNILMGNTIMNNNGSIDLHGYCNNNIITGNTIKYNEWYGIDITQHEYPAGDNNNNTITGNTITDNSDGIQAGSSNNETIIGNTIANTYEGIYLSHGSGSTIYYNNFINNTKHATTYDAGENDWDNGYPSGGNYWDNYMGVDANGDLIGDIPYFIPENITNNMDRYPLMIKYNVTANKPPLANFTYSIKGHLVNFTDLSIDTDGSIKVWYWDFGDKNNSFEPYHPTHEYLEEGNYTVKLRVTDDYGGTDSFTRVITVEEDDSGGIPHSVEFILTILSIIGLIFVAITVWKFL